MCHIIKQLMTFNLNNIFTSAAGLGKYNILGLINPCIHLIKSHQLYTVATTLAPLLVKPHLLQ